MLIELLLTALPLHFHFEKKNLTSVREGPIFSGRDSLIREGGIGRRYYTGVGNKHAYSNIAASHKETIKSVYLSFKILWHPSAGKLCKRNKKERSSPGVINKVIVEYHQ